jgi:sialic acid synthase SpsE
MKMSGGRVSHKDADYMVRRGKKTIMPKKKGQKKITFQQGGLHASMGIKQGKKMTASQHAAARSGSKGTKAEKQELFFENVLSKGHKKV